MKQIKTKDIIKVLEDKKEVSAWNKGVRKYAIMILEDIIMIPCDYSERQDLLLNGASSWKEYSWGGCALIYNSDIAEMLCSPSELKGTDNGRLQPNKNEQWLDTQARALTQATAKIDNAVRECEKENTIDGLLKVNHYEFLRKKVLYND